MSVSNFKNMGFRNNFKEFDSFKFLKIETHWDCRSYRIYGNLANRSTVETRVYHRIWDKRYF